MCLTSHKRVAHKATHSSFNALENECSIKIIVNKEVNVHTIENRSGDVTSQ